MVTVEQDLSEALAPIESVTRYLWIHFIGVFATVILLALYFSFKLERPVMEEELHLHEEHVPAGMRKPARADLAEEGPVALDPVALVEAREGDGARLAPIRERRAPSAARLSRASESAAASPGATSRPETPSSTTSTIPPVREATAGRPQAAASTRAMPSASNTDGNTKTSAARR